MCLIRLAQAINTFAFQLATKSILFLTFKQNSWIPVSVVNILIDPWSISRQISLSNPSLSGFVFTPDSIIDFVINQISRLSIVSCSFQSLKSRDNLHCQFRQIMSVFDKFEMIRQSFTSAIRANQIFTLNLCLLFSHSHHSISFLQNWHYQIFVRIFGNIFRSFESFLFHWDPSIPQAIDHSIRESVKQSITQSLNGSIT
jgi:hypothetical protein